MLEHLPTNVHVPDGYALVKTGDVKPRLDLVLSDCKTWGKIQPVDIEILGREVHAYYAVVRPVGK